MVNGKLLVPALSIALCGIAAPASAGYREDVAHCEEQASSHSESIPRSHTSPVVTVLSDAAIFLSDAAISALSGRDALDSLSRSAQRGVRSAERDVLMEERRQETAFKTCMREMERERSR